MVKDKILSLWQIILGQFCRFFSIVKRSSNLRTRFLSSVVLIIVAIAAILYSKILFYFLATIIIFLMTHEWCDLTKRSKNQGRWLLFGLIYIVTPMTSLFILHDFNKNILLWLFAVVAATDTFAYFAGKAIGGPKMSPKISPNKTWSGLIFGVISAILVGSLSSIMFAGSAVFFAVISAVMALLAQGGDLIESKIKRIFDVKDSGNIIPGHGGILDRFDGIILVAPFVLVAYLVFPGSLI